MSRKHRITKLEAGKVHRNRGIALPLVILSDTAIPGQRPDESLQDACARLGVDYEMAKRRRPLAAMTAGRIRANPGESADQAAQRLGIDSAKQPTVKLTLIQPMQKEITP